MSNYQKMNTKKDIPIQFRNTFKSFEEYKEWCMEKSKNELLKAFENIDLDDYKNRKKETETD